MVCIPKTQTKTSFLTEQIPIQRLFESFSPTETAIFTLDSGSLTHCMVKKKIAMTNIWSEHEVYRFDIVIHI